MGIEDIYVEVLPQGKTEMIIELQADRTRAAIVGDGVNDAAALTTSSPGITMSTDTDVATAASDLTLTRDDLMDVVDAIRLSHVAEHTVHGNLLWAFFYNVAAIPVVALGLLAPMTTGVTTACSSVFVVLSSLKLRNFRQDRLSGFSRIPPIPPGGWGTAVKSVVTSGPDPWKAGVNEDLFPVGRVKGYNRIAWS